jgi:hypothetical protein
MPHRLRGLVAARAGWRCEYCLAPEAIFNSPLEVDHIQPKERGGADDQTNLALACRSCNGSKHLATTARDPLSGRTVDLFNPRMDVWDAHFVLSVPTAEVAGRTDVGRATAVRLKMTGPKQREARRLWILLFSFPDAPPAHDPADDE